MLATEDLDVEELAEERAIVSLSQKGGGCAEKIEFIGGNGFAVVAVPLAASTFTAFLITVTAAISTIVAAVDVHAFTRLSRSVDGISWLASAEALFGGTSIGILFGHR